jgi:uncharacterized LabA/DUF88 family protein
VITNIYIDGFNLYYGALKGTGYKWLNPLDLCRVALKPTHVFNRLRYFTARVHPRPHDPGQPLRQGLYLRALRTLPGVSIHLGHFLVHNVRMPLTSNPAHKVEVVKVEEKGSDVNLATHLLNDAHLGDFACAVVISNDSDLVEAVKIVRNQLKRTVVVLSPHQGSPSRELRREASLFKPFRAHWLSSSQFPATMTDATGAFYKPPEW